MDSIDTPRRESRQSGFVLAAVMALVAVLLATGLAFMRWSSDEALQSREVSGAMQAYYLAQMGIVEEGFAWLRGIQEAALPTGEVILPGRIVPNVGRFSSVTVHYLTGLTGGDFWSEQRRFRISCIGTVRVPVYANGTSDYKDVKRKAVLYVEVRNFADYMYLTECELASFGDRIKFWTGDTLDGRVHSNSEIAVQRSPVFTDLVTSTEADFWRGDSYAPVFLGPDPVFRVAKVEIPSVAERLRNGAQAQGNYFDNGGGKQYWARIENTSVRMSVWDVGSPMDTIHTWQVPIINKCCIFVVGDMDLQGVLHGELTIGASGTVRLINDVKYDDVNQDARWVSPSALHTNYLGIVAERDVKVANTVANGRANSNGSGNNQTNRNFTSIVITAAIVALGESFTFENQNDPDSGYVCTCLPDDRGYMYILGSITQMRRGYVHRTTRSSTGYLKSYHYDQRLKNHRPPCFFDVKDESGRALFNVVQWGQAVEYQPEVARWNMVRYN